MPEIPESYASPWLRWALLVQDHPGATYRFDCVTGSELPDGQQVPKQFGGDEQFCLATIQFPPEANRPDVTAWRATAVGVNLRGGKKGPVTNAEEWNTLTAMVLGRALKRAGYPEDMDDLKALVLWRRREAEIAAIGSGAVTPALPAASGPQDVEAALGAAARPEAESAGIDDTHDAGPPPGVDPETGEIADAVVVEDLPDEVKARHREALNAAAKAQKQVELREWATEQGINFARPANSEQVTAIIARVAELTGGSDG